MPFHFANRQQATGYRKRAVVSSQKAVSKPAFTLIEILVTISIIAIIAGSVIFYGEITLVKARDARRKADIKAIYAALILARSDSASHYYPNNVYAGATISTDGNKTTGGVMVTNGYIKSMPVDKTFFKNPGGTLGCVYDPSYSNCFFGKYIYAPNGPDCDPAVPAKTTCTSFTLTACLENDQDPQRDDPTINGLSFNALCAAAPFSDTGAPTDAVKIRTSYTIASPN